VGGKWLNEHAVFMYWYHSTQNKPWLSANPFTTNPTWKAGDKCP